MLRILRADLQCRHLMLRPHSAAHPAAECLPYQRSIFRICKPRPKLTSLRRDERAPVEIAMKIAYFSTLSHGRTRQPATSWPVPNELFDPDQALRSQEEYFAECRLADEMGFDWVSIAEHHYSPGSLAPSINVLGAALAQHVKRAKIAILGALLPLNNP